LPCRKLHLLLRYAYCFKGGGANTLKFNLHIIRRTKKGCEFNQKRCEFKNHVIILGTITNLWFL
jgi:hypothetical protein